MKEFSGILTGLSEYNQIVSAIKGERTPVGVIGLAGVQKAHLIYCLAPHIKGKNLIITPDESSAVRMKDDINSFCGEGVAVLFPSREYVMRDVEGASHEFEHKRTGALSALANGGKIAVASIEAAAQLTMPQNILKKLTLELSSDESYDIENLIEKLVGMGYQRREQVEGVCQFARRGGILDVFPPSMQNPVRIEFWGDDIDTISTFKVDTQRRYDHMKKVTITPAREVIVDDIDEAISKLEEAASKHKGKQAVAAREKVYEAIESIQGGIMPVYMDRYISLIYPKNNTIFDYFKDGAVYICDPVECKENLKNVLWHHHEDIKLLLDEGIVFKGCDRFYLDFTDVSILASKSTLISLDAFARSIPEIPMKSLYTIKAVQLSGWSGEYGVLKEDLKDYISSKCCCVVFGGTEKNCKALVEYLQKDGISADYLADIKEFVPKKVFVVEGSVSGGFEYRDLCLVVISHSRLGIVSAKAKKKKQTGQKLKNISDLAVGDYVVHISHGIGVFSGIVKREISGITKDYIKIRYAGTDTLFVPVTQLDLVTKYIGGKEEGNIKLNKLNSAEWQKTRQRVKSAVKDMAEDLIKLYSERMNAKGFAFSKDTDWQNDFDGRFPYEETDDQLRCIEEIKSDMESTIPMDRLLCGDVGFGKTEVAIRAAFKCVMDNKQCAVLVPTTILAWQHYQTFTQRMEGFPVKIELLSRFKTAKEQEEIIKDLKRGVIDIVIGTHRVVQKDVQFKDLGLCIIDEEQRFGVSHKEKFKELRSNVDVLTLSATPIPRTLNMAMSGIRDMSTIDEAPQDRQPVQTYVMEHDWGLIAQSINRELRRGGQVFYLHNVVESIDSCAAKIAEFVPEARIVTAHGKMGEEKLSKVWRGLMDHEVDVLVCTTIIETGVDVTNCNTLIIEDADKMGLSQLYQLRGRVGRSNRRAYAYLTVKAGKALSDIATKRLAAIREFTTFGSGFRIAMRDLEIRGAGNILGAQQHGHMEAVGYEMYLKLLSEAVAVQKGEKVPNVAEECTVDIQISAHIPEDYIENINQRIDIYKKIAAIQSDDDAMDITDELIDRFGDPPSSVTGLVEVSLIRNKAAYAGISEISQKNGCIILYPEKFDMEKAGILASRLKGRVTVNVGAKPYLSVRIMKGEKAINVIKLALENMIENKEKA